MKLTANFDSLEEFQEYLAWKESRIKTLLQDSGLSTRLVQSLLDEGVKFVEDAQAITDYSLGHFPGVGKRSIAELRAWKRPAEK